ncbi:uncharacterized protein EV420DRAFT_1506777 [Desarmillaria tabescens]|uniref:Zn(2)-C6 fungal-type domain-containing protein n=1 Tax=Armillaria tabescens TaxID=1929756 RepID=A0AA39NJY5_ARMTA|nr:uncharacterized protein EV420DRAFT_1506777 [Desarmillaria tabescens]KAK0467026.1 hypothetical protein EV420DRAFT_1506777 [Desarmillaria tabescens]
MNPPSHLLPHQQPIDMSLLSFSLGKALKNGKRTDQACISYSRRDKVGCDGNRPCGVCTKKGYAPDQCVTGCGPCRKARVRCEDGAPCQRCREMGLPCVDANADARRSIQQNSLPSRSTRPNGRERVKLACEACRKDNKKCDEQRPCGRCVIRKKECVMLERGPKSTKPCGPCRNANEDCINTKRQGGHGHRVKQVGWRLLASTLELMEMLGEIRYVVTVNGRLLSAVSNATYLINFVVDLAHIATVRIMCALTEHVNHVLPPDTLIYVITEPKIPVRMDIGMCIQPLCTLMSSLMVDLTDSRRSSSDSVQPVEQLIMEQQPPQTSMFPDPYFFPPEQSSMGLNPIYENSASAYYPVIDPNLDRPSLVISSSGLTEHL